MSTEIEEKLRDDLATKEKLARLDDAWGAMLNGGTEAYVFLPGVSHPFPLTEARSVLRRLFGFQGDELDQAVQKLETIVHRDIAEAQQPVRPAFNFVNRWMDY